VEEGFTTIGHAVLNNSINFKNRLQKPAFSADLILLEHALYCPSVFYQISYKLSSISYELSIVNEHSEMCHLHDAKLLL